ncbi:hypothetical protein [Labrys monachus]|uniref:Uncharacterized protein n=1 Tax=Labrys monachus TaxID=217067 RepID=A0ABU0FJE3_9HYPH|nr:hypothetical protein [Labrys monachus]MDQ0394170.1 hypothetical protein [Labrys monachus]
MTGFDRKKNKTWTSDRDGIRQIGMLAGTAAVGGKTRQQIRRSLPSSLYGLLAWACMFICPAGATPLLHAALAGPGGSVEALRSLQPQSGLLLRVRNRSGAESRSRDMLDWRTIVARAIELSKAQNRGHVQVGRTCQPEFAACTIAIFFRDRKGRLTMLRSAEDADGRLLARDICELNDFWDVRTCTSWETGVTTKEMKDLRGNWQAVQ